MHENEIVDVIRKLKMKKAVGLDGIPNEAWIHANDELVEVRY